MGDRIRIEVFDRATGDRRVETVGMPVEIGKAPQSANSIRLDPDRATVSRRHGRLELAGGTFIYVDTSSNGTTVAGAPLKGGRREVDAGDLIQIENYELRILETEAAELKLTDAALAPVDGLRLAPGDTCFVGGSWEAPRLVASDGATPAADTTAGDLLLRLSFDGTQLLIEPIDGVSAHPVRINNRSVALPARAAMFDVIGAGARRIEFLQPNRDKVVCGNAECHLLNDLPFEGNCVWCGYYLAASGSFTRVTPP